MVGEWLSIGLVFAAAGLQFVVSPWQLGARERLEHVAAVSGAQLLIACRRDLKIVRLALSALLILFFLIAYVLRINAPGRDESYVLIGMVLALFVAISGWQSWIYWKLARGLDASLRRLAVRLALVTSFFDCVLGAALYLVFLNLTRA